jgi:hypothetical protein
MPIALRRVATYVASILAAAISIGVAPFVLGERPSDPAPAQTPPLQSLLAERGWSFGIDDTAEEDLGLVPFDSLIFERGPCFGDCPVYRMILHKSGRAELTRDHLNSELSTSLSGKISPFHFARLAQLAALAETSATETSYAGQWTDDYTVQIIATGGRGTWEVSDYGQVAPPAVWALEELLHSTYQATTWTQVEAGN